MRGFNMNVNVTMSWDDEARVWVAVSDKGGLVLEDSSYDTLINRVKTALPELLELNNLPKCTEISFISNYRMKIA